jgi:hypothetical protein
MTKNKEVKKEFKGKIKNVGLELSLNKNEQRRDTHLGISRRHEVHDVPVWLRCRRAKKTA